MQRQPDIPDVISVKRRIVQSERAALHREILQLTTAKLSPCRVTCCHAVVHASVMNFFITRATNACP